MTSAKFSAEEIAEFESWFARTRAWTGWRRRAGGEGSDVIEVFVDGRRPTTLRIAKSGAGTYLATGFDGWALTVADDLFELLAILSGYRPEEAPTGRQRLPIDTPHAA